MDASSGDDNVSILRHPVFVIKLFCQFCQFCHRHLAVYFERYHRRIIKASLAAAAIIYIMLMIPSFHQLVSLAVWYMEWFALGIMSSIGFGSGAHTFMLFLAPLIAETARTAFACSSLQFDIRGPKRSISRSLSLVLSACAAENIQRWSLCLEL